MNSAFVILNHPVSDAGPPPWFHLITAARPLAFVVEGSRVFEIDPTLADGLQQGDPAAEGELRKAAGSIPAPPNAADHLRPPAAVSLHIAQSCNLACTYCYADEGRFGGSAEFMPAHVARSAIERILTGAKGRRVTIGFIGGEPFLNRPVLYESVDYASRRARELGTPVGFSVTTNATLLTAEDRALLRRHAFVVSVSLDGSPEMNDRERPSRDETSSAKAALARLEPLLRSPGRARIAVRATIPRHDLRVAERISALALAGFTEIGVSPVRTSPKAGQVLRGDDWGAYLSEMKRAAELEWDRLLCGEDWRFANLATAVKQIHQGAARGLPCGAGDNYVSVSAQGEYYACHRTIADPRFYLGHEPDIGRRRQFLAPRHVDSQEPCRTCWARYLCGGGCHAEVADHGRTGCDFIRGWLEYCIRFHGRVLAVRPDLLSDHRFAAAKLSEVEEV